MCLFILLFIFATTHSVVWGDIISIFFREKLVPSKDTHFVVIPLHPFPLEMQCKQFLISWLMALLPLLHDL